MLCIAHQVSTTGMPVVVAIYLCCCDLVKGPPTDFKAVWLLGAGFHRTVRSTLNTSNGRVRLQNPGLGSRDGHGTHGFSRLYIYYCGQWGVPGELVKNLL